MNTRITQAIEALRHGGMILVTDHPDREDEADLIMAAEFATAETINFMSRYGRGLICLALTAEQVDRLALPMMVQENRATFATPFTVSIDAAQGVRGGISAHERALTIQQAIHPSCLPDDLVSPGHIFPLRAHPEGLAARQGHTEASIFLVQQAACQSAAVICEVLAEDGQMLRGQALQAFAQYHQLPLISIEEIVAAQNLSVLNEQHVLQKISQSYLPTEHGDWQISIWLHHALGEFTVLQQGDLRNNKNPLVRIHSSCLTGDVFGSLRCDCGQQLSLAMQKIAEEESGLIIYLSQEGRGIGLANKIRAYALQDQGHDTVSANLALGLPVDARDYQALSALLAALDIQAMRLLTNNPRKIVAMQTILGKHAVKPVPLIGNISATNRAYLTIKQQLLGHSLKII